MLLFLYCIYDRVAGTYGDLFMAQKPELAVRKFRYVLQNSPMVAADCDLFEVGSFDTETGVITSLPPKFIDRLPVQGGVNE